MTMDIAAEATCNYLFNKLNEANGTIATQTGTIAELTAKLAEATKPKDETNGQIKTQEAVKASRPKRQTG